MQFFKNTNIDFMSKTKYAIVISGILIFSGVGSLLYKGGPSLSSDFTGGLRIQLTTAEVFQDENENGIYDDSDKLLYVSLIDNKEKINKINYQDAPQGTYIYDLNGNNIYDPPLEDAKINIEEVSSALADIEISNPRVHYIRDSEYTIEVQIPPPNESNNYEKDAVIQTITNIIGPNNMLSSNFVGPSIGAELKSDAMKAILIALILITIYISFRFDRFYAYGSFVALVHDLLIALGIFSIFDIEISLQIIAAFLTILGYSLNDTIVVFDRLREIKNKFSNESINNIINKSLNATLGRTVITSLTTFMAVLALFIWGGDRLRDFSFALLIGVVVGTYSSIFVASPVLKYFESRKEPLDEDTNLHEND